MVIVLFCFFFTRLTMSVCSDVSKPLQVSMIQTDIKSLKYETCNGFETSNKSRSRGRVQKEGNHFYNPQEPEQIFNFAV